MACISSGLLLCASLLLGGALQQGQQENAAAPPAEEGREDAASSSSSSSHSDASGAGAQRTIPFVPTHRQANRIAVLTVEGEIDELTLHSLERRIERAADEGYDAVVIELDTPGGYLHSALDIVHLLKTQAPVNTVAWVRPDAYSAGTLIALACREIVVSPDATWGDCAPIQVMITELMAMPAAERAKVEGPLRAAVVDSARRFGYDERLVESFISVNLELWMLENTTTNERIFVNRYEYNQIFGEEPPDQLARDNPDNRADAAWQLPRRPVLPNFDNSLIEPYDDGLTSDQRERQLEETVRSEQTLPSARPPIDTLDADEWVLLRQVVSDSQLLTLNAAESIEYGLANAVIRNDQELVEYFGTANLNPAADMIRWEESWSESLVRFLVNGWMRAILGAIFIIGLFLELAAPGLGIFGAVAAAALLVMVGAPFLVGMAEWWEILLIFLGLALIGVEVFVLPGFGVAGISGVICVLVGVVGSFVAGDVGTERGQEQMLYGVGWTVAAIFGAGVGIWLLSRYVYEFPIFRRLILSATIDSKSSTIEAESSVAAAPAAPRTPMLDIGDEGLADTHLRPGGRAIINGRTFDVVSAGPWIERGQRVRVTRVGDFRIEVDVA